MFYLAFIFSFVVPVSALCSILNRGPCSSASSSQDAPPAPATAASTSAAPAATAVSSHAQQLRNYRNQQRERHFLRREIGRFEHGAWRRLADSWQRMLTAADGRSFEAACKPAYVTLRKLDGRGAAFVQCWFQNLAESHQRRQDITREVRARLRGADEGSAKELTQEDLEFRESLMEDAFPIMHKEAQLQYTRDLRSLRDILP